MGRPLCITLQIKGVIVPLRGMVCRGRSSEDWTTLVMGCAGAGSKARKWSDQGEEAAWESWGESAQNVLAMCMQYMYGHTVHVCHQPSLSCLLTKLNFYFFSPVWRGCVLWMSSLSASNWKIWVHTYCICVRPRVTTSKDRVGETWEPWGGQGMSLARGWKEQSESWWSSQKVQASYSWVWKSSTGKPGLATREQFLHVCEVTGRPGNPRVSCW